MSELRLLFDPAPAAADAPANGPVFLRVVPDGGAESARHVTWSEAAAAIAQARGDEGQAAHWQAKEAEVDAELTRRASSSSMC